MGKCLSCLRVEQPAHPTDLNQTLQFPHHLLHGSVHHTSSVECDRAKDTSESGSSISAVEGRPSPLPPADAHSNGSSKNSIVINSQEKRSFYSLIPPLAKSASSEVRRLSSKEYSEAKINALFDTYKDANCDAILCEGIERLCIDLDVKPDDFQILLLAWKFGAETMCRFTRQEFVSGCKSLKVDSIKGLQSKFPEMLAEVQDSEKFRELYRFTFKFGLDTEAGQRILPSDMAILLWRLVFLCREPVVLQRWLDFLEKHPSVRGIPRDTWNMFLNFTEVVGDDLNSYDDTEAWPSLFDDFVEYENDQLNQNISKDHKEIN